MSDQSPLQGHRVVELGTAITAPYATMLLADMGAEVVKIESPAGDPFRIWDGTGPSPRFAAFNRNKRSVVLDLRTDAGRSDLVRLVASADALVTNFRPASLAKLGADADTVVQINDRLVYCEITGAGSGPGAERPMYDAVAQGLTGLMSMTSGLADPRPIGPALTDSICGALSAVAVSGALVERERTGHGQVIRTSMIEACLNFLAESLTDHFASGASPGPHTRPRHSQSYGFVCSDGAPLVVHLSTPTKFWEGLLATVGQPDLLDDPRFRTYGDRVGSYDELDAELRPLFATRPRQQWLDDLAANDVPAAPVHTLGEALADPLVASLEMTSTVPGEDGAQGVPIIHRPWRMAWPASYTAPPALGADTESILAGLPDHTAREGVRHG